MSVTGPTPPDSPSADEVPASARASVGAGIRWGVIDQSVQIVVRLGTSIILARLIAPEEFGVFGLALVILNFALVLSGLGLGSALVQRRDLTDRHVTTAFTASALFGLVLAGGVALAGIPAAAFFREPRLRSLVALLATTFVLRGLELTPNDMLVRAMRFRSYYISSTMATLGAGVGAVVVAAAGGGVLALAVMMLIESAVACVLAWVLAIAERVWRPSFGFHRKEFGDLAGFSAYVTATRLVSYGAGNGDNLVIGRVLGPTALGYYALAYRVMLLPLQRFGEIVAASAFPALASVQDDLGKLRSGYLDAVRYISAVCFPVTIGIAVTAPLAVPLVLGVRWEPAVHPLQVLAVSGPLLSVNRLTGTLANAIGRAKWAFWLNLTGLVVYIPAFLVGVRHGISGVAVAFFVATLAMTIPEFRIATRALELGVWPLVRAVIPVTLSTAAMAAVAALLQRWLRNEPDLLRLIAAVVGGGAAYALVLWRTDPSLISGGLRLSGRRS